jgi:hypothetical protein
MKKIAVVFALIISCQFSVKAQEITLKPSKLESVLCKRWQVEYAKMGEMKIEQIPGATDFDLLFDKNGTYQVIKTDSEDSQSGTWTYDTKNNSVELEANGNVKFQVKSITKEKLILSLNLGDDAPPGMSNLELHLKP